ncbi:hypothetical protein [Endozoicomonas lisbonensis]|uniref:HTH merR-type domain-containing protein n=1 Tax=Endozoicomonas lisbonensis TaxID=3120522 RepID=A0ABV2SE76_9GAMM
MDATGHYQPGLPTAKDQKPSDKPEEAKKTSHAGRTVSQQSPKDSSSIIAQAKALAGPDKHQTEQLVAKRKTDAAITEAAEKLDLSTRAIKKFIKTNDLYKPVEVEYGLHGFSDKSQRLFILMSQYKDLILEHTGLLNQIYGIISPVSPKFKMVDKAVRAAAIKRNQTPEEKALLEEVSAVPGSDERKAAYWNERGYIRLYSAFCKQRFGAVCKAPPMLEKLRDKDLYILRAEEFIAQNLEWMGVLAEVMQCSIAQHRVAELESCIKEFDVAAEGAAAIIKDSVIVYMANEKQEELRAVLADNRHYLEHWLEIFRDSKQKPCDSQKCINAIVTAMVLDKPEVALELLAEFSHRIKSGDLPAKDCMLFCMPLMSAVTWLYDRAEPLGEHKKRVEGAKKIVDAFGELIRHIDENRLVNDENRASLLHLFPKINLHCDAIVQRLRTLEQRGLDIGNELIREEEAQKQKVQTKLEKRERRRQRRIAQQQTARAASPDAPVNEPDNRPDYEVQLHPSLVKALDAVSRKESNKVVKSAFNEVIEDKDASVFDKAQAHYGYADVLAIRLVPRLEKLIALVDATYDYELVLQTGQLPPPEHEFRFNDVLREFKDQVKDVNWGVLEIAQAIRSALDVFYELEDEQTEFLDQLLELHHLAEDLTKQAEKVSACCMRLPEIYQRRGEVLRQLPKTGRSGKGNKEIIEESMRDIQRFSVKLNGSIAFIKNLLNKKNIKDTVKEAQQDCATARRPRRVRFSDESMIDTLPVQLRNEVKRATGIPDTRTEPATAPEQAEGLVQEAPSEQVLPDEPSASALSSQAVNQPVSEEDRSGAEASGSAETKAEAIAAESQEPQPFQLPFGLFMPGDVFDSLEQSLKDTQLSWQMGKRGLTAVKHTEAASAPEASTGAKEPQQSGKGKKKGKGKKQKAAVKKQVESKKDDMLAATGNIMQLRVRDYLQALITDEKKPNGKPLPEKFNLEGVKARIQAGTFLSNPGSLEDFAILSDALGIPVRLTAKATEVFNCRTGLSKPLKIEMNEYPEAPYLSLEYFTTEKDRHWFTSLPHLFEYVEEETARKLEQKKQ